MIKNAFAATAIAAVLTTQVGAGGLNAPEMTMAPNNVVAEVVEQSGDKNLFLPFILFAAFALIAGSGSNAPVPG